MMASKRNATGGRFERIVLTQQSRRDRHERHDQCCSVRECKADGVAIRRPLPSSHRGEETNAKSHMPIRDNDFAATGSAEARESVRLLRRSSPTYMVAHAHRDNRARGGVIDRAP